MRQVKIVERDGYHQVSDQELINQALMEIQRNNGTIVNMTYLAEMRGGVLATTIIEYDIAQPYENAKPTVPVRRRSCGMCR